MSQRRTLACVIGFSFYIVLHQNGWKVSSRFFFLPDEKEKLRFLPEDGALLHPPSIV
jgi:hypothetical protein